MINKLYAFWFFDEGRRTCVLIVSWCVIVVFGLITASYFISAFLGIMVAVLWPLVQPLGSLLRGADIVVRRAIAVVVMMLILIALPFASAQMQQSLVVSTLRMLAAGRITSDQMIRTERTLTEAARAGVLVDRDLLAKAGRALSSSPEFGTSPSMWRVVTKAVDYQSSLRQELAPDVNGAVPSGADDRMAFMFRVLSLDKAPRIEFYGQVPAAEGAIAELIGSPFHSDMQMRPKYIIISYPSGVPMELGRMHLRNVIIRDSDVYYEGTPLVMENVFFVNCRFRIKETPNQSRFVMALMNPGAIHFES